MAWEWLDAASGLVVGVAGITGGAWIAGRGRTQDERMANARFEHEQRTAHSQWHRERKADAYVQLLEMAESAGLWAAFVQPLTYSKGDPKPDLPPLPEQALVAARVNAFGSERVKERLAAWRAVIKEMTYADEAGERRRIGLELRPAEEQRRRELAQAIAEELNQV